jgi:hypothetical protein
MTVIEIRQHRWGWKAFESPGVEPVFPKKDQAIDANNNVPCNRVPTARRKKGFRKAGRSTAQAGIGEYAWLGRSVNPLGIRQFQACRKAPFLGRFFRLFFKKMFQLGARLSPTFLGAGTVAGDFLRPA